MVSDTSLNMPYLVVAIVIIGAVLTAALVNIPQVQSIMANRTQVGRLNEEINLISQEIAQTDQKLAAFNQLKNYEDQMNIVLPTEDSEDDILHILSSTANTAGVLLKKIDNNTEGFRRRQEANSRRDVSDNLPAGVTVVSYSLEFQGNYSQIRAFITELERSPRLAEVNSVSVSQDAKNPEQLSVASTLYLYTFLAEN